MGDPVCTELTLLSQRWEDTTDSTYLLLSGHYQVSTRWLPGDYQVTSRPRPSMPMSTVTELLVFAGFRLWRSLTDNCGRLLVSKSCHWLRLRCTQCTHCTQCTQRTPGYLQKSTKEHIKTSLKTPTWISPLSSQKWSLFTL